MFKVGATQALIAMARHSFIWGWLGVRARLQRVGEECLSRKPWLASAYTRVCASTQLW